MQFNEFSVRSGREGDIHTVVPSGELDVATAPDLEAELLRAEATDAHAIVLDLSELAFISSPGLRPILAADQRSQANSARLRLVRPPPQILRVVEISGLSEHLPFRDA